MPGFCQIEQSLVKSKSLLFPVLGAIAQLGERIVRNDEVVGSIPTSSTISPSDIARAVVVDYPKNLFQVSLEPLRN
jgi:hypothetical protein